MKKLGVALLLIISLSACERGIEEVTAPDIILNGTSVVNIEVGDTYEDAGAYIDSEDDYQLNVSNLVDTSLPGEYTVTYYYTFEGNTITKVRTVNVEDDFAVTFYLLGDDTVTIEIGQSYTDAGIFISDVTVPVDVTDNVDITTVGTYTITFSITVGGETRSVTRTLQVVPALLTLTGGSTVTLAVGSTWVDPGYTLTDTTVQVQVNDSALDMNTVGTYEIYYQYVFENNLVTITRTVIVE